MGYLVSSDSNVFMFESEVLKKHNLLLKLCCHLNKIKYKGNIYYFVLISDRNLASTNSNYLQNLIISWTKTLSLSNFKSIVINRSRTCREKSKWFKKNCNRSLPWQKKHKFLRISNTPCFLLRVGNICFFGIFLQIRYHKNCHIFDFNKLLRNMNNYLFYFW